MPVGSGGGPDMVGCTEGSGGMLGSAGGALVAGSGGGAEVPATLRSPPWSVTREVGEPKSLAGMSFVASVMNTRHTCAGSAPPYAEKPGIRSGFLSVWNIATEAASCGTKPLNQIALPL